MEVRAGAQEAFASREWQAAYDAFRECDDLDAGDHDALAESAHWLGQGDEAVEAYTVAYRLHVKAGEPRRAALSAFNAAIYLRLRGDGAHADGWLARAQRLLATAGRRT